jgi:heptaprenyl diphosphate synthase
VSGLAASLGITLDEAAGAQRDLVDALEDGLRRVEIALERDVALTDPVAASMTRYLKDAGGKRTRPMLVMLAAQLGDGITDDVVAAAEVVEITHLASLYHDDVMDRASMRRGVPAAHEVWGNSVAILAGDLLFARAGAVGASLGSEFATIHAHTFERMCLGQLHETLGAREGDPVEHYIRVLADKTGSLIASAAELGALMANADPSYRQPLRDYGERIGVAFQLVDDVLDLSSSPETGKVAGTDLRTGVMTLPLLRLRAAAATDADSASLLADIDRKGDDFPDAVRRLREHPATLDTLAEAERWRAGAHEALTALPAGAARDALDAFAASLVTRTR